VIFRTVTNAATPRITDESTYTNPKTALPSSASYTTSTENLESVVSPPQKPSPSTATVEG
jgi:hypothetical protein